MADAYSEQVLRDFGLLMPGSCAERGEMPVRTLTERPKREELREKEGKAEGGGGGKALHVDLGSLKFRVFKSPLGSIVASCKPHYHFRGPWRVMFDVSLAPEELFGGNMEVLVIEMGEYLGMTDRQIGWLESLDHINVHIYDEERKVWSGITRGWKGEGGVKTIPGRGGGSRELSDGREDFVYSREVGIMINSAMQPVIDTIDDFSRRLTRSTTRIETLEDTADDHETRIEALEAGGGGGGGGDTYTNLAVTGTLTLGTGNNSRKSNITTGSFTGDTTNVQTIALHTVSNADSAYYFEGRIIFMSGTSGAYVRDVLTFRVLVEGGSAGEVAFAIEDIDLIINGNQIEPDEVGDPLYVSGGNLLFAFKTAQGAGVTYRYVCVADVVRIHHV